MLRQNIVVPGRLVAYDRRLALQIQGEWKQEVAIIVLREILES